MRIKGIYVVARFFKLIIGMKGFAVVVKIFIQLLEKWVAVVAGIYLTIEIKGVAVVAENFYLHMRIKGLAVRNSYYSMRGKEVAIVIMIHI